MNLQLDSIETDNGVGYVVRDDLLEGGTKQRAIIPFIEELKRKGYTNFIYASPFSGFAQVALASAIRQTGITCSIFAEQTPERTLHSFTLKAQRMGAKIIACSSLREAEDLAEAYANRSSEFYKIPLGFNEPIYKRFLKAEIERLWPLLRDPSRLWLPVGSGTLVHIFRDVVPLSTHIHCVDVHVLGGEDERIRTVQNLPNTTYYSARQTFHDECPFECPVPSNAYYDRKVYEVFSKEADDGDVWWNVAQ